MGECCSEAVAVAKKTSVVRRGITWLNRIFWVGAILIVGTVVVWDAVDRQSLREEITRIRSANEPVTLNDLAAMQKPVPEDQNAARFYLAAMALEMGHERVDDLLGWECSGAACTTGPAELDVAAAKKVLEENRTALELVDRGATMPAVSSGPWITWTFDQQVSRWGKVRRMCRLVSLRTHVLAVEGKMDKAVESLVSGIRFGRILADQPFAIDQMTCHACSMRMYSDIRFVVSKGKVPVDDAALMRIQTAVRETHVMPARDILMGERVNSVERMREGLASVLDTSDRHVPESRWMAQLPGPVVRYIAVDYLKTMRAMIDAASVPWPETPVAVERVPEESVWASLVGGTSRAIVGHQATAIAKRDAAIVAVAAERYRLKYAKMPETLEVLVPEFVEKVPMDPFTGKAMKYRCDEKGYVVYSVGEDLKDDGGVLDHEVKRKGGTVDHGMWIEKK